jgi:hypothetical protein
VAEWQGGSGAIVAGWQWWCGAVAAVAVAVTGVLLFLKCQCQPRQIKSQSGFISIIKSDIAKPQKLTLPVVFGIKMTALPHSIQPLCCTTTPSTATRTAAPFPSYSQAPPTLFKHTQKVATSAKKTRHRQARNATFPGVFGIKMTALPHPVSSFPSTTTPATAARTAAPFPSHSQSPPINANRSDIKKRHQQKKTRHCPSPKS